jgi:hypothetical protein
MGIVITLIVVAGLAWALGRMATRSQKILNPTLGILDVTAGGSTAIIAEDKAALADLFSAVVESTNAAPRCDVLFLYATLGLRGELVGTDRSLRATIRESGAKVVVVASENPDPKPTKPGPGDAKANLVITLQRNGAKFPRFFRELFDRMKKGQSMPMAWVKIVPQGPSRKHDECPGTIFLMEVGPISFR